MNNKVPENKQKMYTYPPRSCFSVITPFAELIRHLRILSVGTSKEHHHLQWTRVAQPKQKNVSRIGWLKLVENRNLRPEVLDVERFVDNGFQLSAVGIHRLHQRNLEDLNGVLSAGGNQHFRCSVKIERRDVARRRKSVGEMLYKLYTGG
jgi:hypothetical protein